MGPSYVSYRQEIMKMAIMCLLFVIAMGSQILQQESLAVTIYNNDFAMVKDVRNISFDVGQSTLYFTDVSSNIQTETVTFKAVEDPESVRVYEQNFEKNLVNQEAIMRRYIGKQIEVIANFGNQVRKVTGTLLSYNGEYILQTSNGVAILQSISSIDLPELPEGFFTVPTLNWRVFSDRAQTQHCEVAYRTTGFSWKSDYSMTLNADESLGDIGGWVTIDNNSGKKYENAKLKLIAGDVNTVQTYTDGYYIDDVQEEEAEDEAVGGAPEFSEKSFADYHLYTLSEPVTLTEASQKQVEFIPKVFGVRLRKYNQIVINTGGHTRKDLKAASKIEFANSKQLGLGIPFPKGTFRVFKEDEDDGSLEFIGEDSIDHTSKDQNINLNIGNAFDIVANLYSENRKSYSGGGYRAQMNLTIVNHKSTPSEIQVQMNTYYGENLELDWLESNGAKLQKVTSNQYKIIALAQPDQTIVYKWIQNYTP